MAYEVLYGLTGIAFGLLMGWSYWNKQTLPYCREHKDIGYVKTAKFCTQCAKPLYKKVLKEVLVK
jgi:hypothetical protein